MRITLHMEGGLAHFPGLARPHVVDTTSLTQPDAKALEDLVEQAEFFTRPAPSDAPRGADRRTYEIAVEQGERKRVLRVQEPLGPELSALVAHLRK